MERSCTNSLPLESFKKHLFNALKTPGRFAISRTTLLVFGLYLGTFSITNATSTFCGSRFHDLEPTAARTVTTLATLSANVPLGIYKDTVYSRLFGCAALPLGDPITSMAPRTPLCTFCAFLFRDAVTIYTSFALPDIVSSYVPESSLLNAQSKAVAVQLLVPALGQVSNTPIHLIGLEIYNKQGHAKLSGIVSVLRRDFITASVTRMCRIIPAFGFGTLANKELRESLNCCLDLITWVNSIHICDS